MTCERIGQYGMREGEEGESQRTPDGLLSRSVLPPDIDRTDCKRSRAESLCKHPPLLIFPLSRHRVGVEKDLDEDVYLWRTERGIVASCGEEATFLAFPNEGGEGLTEREGGGAAASGALIDGSGWELSEKEEREGVSARCWVKAERGGKREHTAGVVASRRSATRTEGLKGA